MLAKITAFSAIGLIFLWFGPGEAQIYRYRFNCEEVKVEEGLSACKCTPNDTNPFEGRTDVTFWCDKDDGSESSTTEHVSLTFLYETKKDRSCESDKWLCNDNEKHYDEFPFECTSKGVEDGNETCSCSPSNDEGKSVFGKVDPSKLLYSCYQENGEETMDESDSIPFEYVKTGDQVGTCTTDKWQCSETLQMPQYPFKCEEAEDGSCECNPEDTNAFGGRSEVKMYCHDTKYYDTANKLPVVWDLQSDDESCASKTITCEENVDEE
ncbi:hypothetical protein Ddc_17297 [Ditylenchus destructor]|nr:hypothetical protein Ddc_17297 [Ditylenchus destructor]